jgi:hypothetical protein
MQKVFQCEKRNDVELICERGSMRVRSDPSIESKNSVTLLILNCESLDERFSAVDDRV